MLESVHHVVPVRRKATGNLNEETMDQTVILNDNVYVVNATTPQSPAFIVHGIVIPALQSLLSTVLASIDASIPNKDQNRAVKRIIREGFDKTYFRILNGVLPDQEFSGTQGSYALEPEPEKTWSNVLPK